jgi:general secretion pathway protein F
MPEYSWRAAEASGRVSAGRMEAASAEQAVQRLKAQGLVPLAVDAAQPGGGPALSAAAPVSAPAFFGWRRESKVNRADVLALTNELAIMLRAGLPMAQALRLLVDMSPKPEVRSLVEAVLEDVKGGAPLSRALARHGGIFGPFYISLARAGEASGQLGPVMERIAAYLTRMAAMREGVISAATYPLILLVVSVLSLVGIMGFVVPQFEKLFADMGDAVPLATRIIVGISHFLRSWGVELLIVLITAGWLAARWAARPEGRVKLQQALLRLPLVGRLVRDFQVATFARTLGTLTGNGVPLLAALDIAVSTVSSQPIRQALAQLLSPVKAGGRLAAAMQQSGQFEPLAVNLVRVGEETGRLAPMLMELAELADRRAETGVKRLLTLLEPALIIVLGVMIAAIIISILLGILSVNDLAL